MKVKAPFAIFHGEVHSLQVIKIHTFTAEGRTLALGHLYCPPSRVHSTGTLVPKENVPKVPL